MFKMRKIQRRANALYTQIREENADIVINGESFYEPQYILEFKTGGAIYRARFTDESFPLKLKYGETVRTKSNDIASFAAFTIASHEFERQGKRYIEICDICKSI